MTKTRLKIAIIFLGRGGGCGSHTIELASEMQHHCDLVGYFAENCCYRERMAALECPVKFFPTYDRLPTFLYSTLFSGTMGRIERAIEEQAPDFVLDTGSVWPTIMYRRKASSGPRWARMIHDAAMHEDSQTLSHLLRRLFPVSGDVLIGVSDFSARELRKLFPDKPVIASRVGFQHSLGETNLDRVARNRRNFLFFGRVEKYKGVETLIEAFSLAKAVDPELHLVIAGRGHISPESKSLAEKSDVTLMNDFIPEEQIADLIKAAGVIVLPYLSATQSGVSAIGLANGLPMVATNVGGLPEHVIDGINGRLVPAGDPAALSEAMLSVSRNEDDARKMGRESLRLGETLFSWDSIARDLLADLAAVGLTSTTAE